MGGTKGQKREPQCLHLLLLRDSEGAVIDWRLQAPLQVGEALPPVNRDSDGGQVLNQYLRCRKVLMALRDEAKQQGEQLTSYSFRHRYAKGMHTAKNLIANISEAMGYTNDVQFKSYARFKPNANVDLVAALNF